MLTAAIVFGLAPAALILVLGIVARGVATQHVTPRVVQYAPERTSTVLRDALLVEADRRAASAALIDLAVKRKVRLLAGSDRRDPIGVEVEPAVVFTSEELSLLDALFGADHTSTRVRRFSSDRRALTGRLKTLLLGTEDALARDGLIGERRVSWPGGALRVLAYLGMLVEALLIMFALLNNAWPALIITLIALAGTIATIFVTPPWWRKYLPPAQAKREHLAGLRRYLALAEADRLRALQSPGGAELRADAPGAAVPAGQGNGGPATTGSSLPGSAAGSADALHPSEGPPPTEPLARFHLHERLLPYAVLFGLEREWITKLRLEAAAIGTDDADFAAVTVSVADALDAAGGALELTASVGDLVDGSGEVIEGIGGLFEAFGL
ncbi:DUF2207 domain-containing protein [Agromyces humatus]|uniref:DUF2207 domain-containing protein n=1 Tax=Agromyces humatus TaxID=279573 RepID=A0ABP4WMX2_9MICO|nr:DUF2207 domain-containing protein [Agromyces humatus]